MRKRGVAAVTAILSMVVLLAAGLSIASLVSNEGISNFIFFDGVKTEILADAGLEIGIRSVLNDSLATIQTTNPSANGFGSSTNFDGATASGTARNPNNALTEDEDDDDGSDARLRSLGDFVRVNSFRQTLNHWGARIQDVEIGIRYQSHSSGHSGTIRVEYSTDNFASVGPTWMDVNVDSPVMQELSVSVAADRTWSWNDLANGSLSVRATMTSQGSVGSQLHVEHLYLMVTYELDTLREPWALQSMQPIGDGQLDVGLIQDESGKIHLNYASYALLETLFEQAGIGAWRATNLANSTTSYRSAQPFTTVDEFRSIAAAPTVTEYNAVRNFLTVTSRVNPYAESPNGPRPPVNINTASPTVLHAVFRPLFTISPSARTSLVNDIVTTRAATPFTTFRSTSPGVLTDYYDFVNSRPYLDTTSKQWLWQNGDATNNLWGGPNLTTLTTEFSYEGYAFQITANASKGNVRRSITTVVADTGTLRPANFIGQLNPEVHTLENF